ncbi:tripartite tricarboxylate transporter permease [Aurantimonas sp. A2-1-M11]|uniref:tripartite tricarboxylate transporter permease n=1 Tax=Aurantimonas sp. A2-1-M11 TaxID=3113712 RepID=UPI002F930D0D
MENILLGLETAFSTSNLLYCLLGVFLGTFVGVLPGIGASAAVSMLLPVSFYLDPTTALVMLAGVYYGAEYGGSTASILLNLPGTSSNAITCLDGYAMTRQGRGGVALVTSALSSFVGGSIGILALTFLTPAIVSVALSFGAAEYFAALLLGLIASAGVAQGSPLKGLAMVFGGVMLGLIGIDVNTGTERFTFGVIELFDGIELVVVAMGLFGIAEVIGAIGKGSGGHRVQKVSLREMVPTGADIRHSILPTLRGTLIGGILGALPATGPTLSAFMSYATEKRLARDPTRFGKGAIEGVAGPEAANNAAAQTSFIPTLALGIPGSATMAIMFGALLIHGITPGPRLMVDHPSMFWGLIVSFWIGNVLLLALNIPLIGLWVRILQVPSRFLNPAIICFVCIGAFSLNNSVFDVWMVLLFGVVGHGMRLLRLEPAPFLIGFILGPLLEENFRRAMLLAGGDVLKIIERPVAGPILGATVLAIILILLAPLMRRSSRPSPQGAE